MRKILFFTILTLLVFSLIACDNGNTNLKANTISETKLTEREQAILTTTANQSFIFDFNVDDKYKNVDLWVEKYESGKLVGKVNDISTEIKNKGTIIFTTSNTIEESNQALFTISVHNDGSTAAGSNQETVPKDYLSIVSGSNPLDNASITDQMILASICYSSSEDEVSTLSSDFYRDADKHMDELKDYEVVYLLRSEFK
ncbi:hypothetical protein [Bacillus sp. FJAT-52991]|uniref:Lipoprotein n=1 Tax=Bacillus kandeliae TaxID=3129297 RepID=A0ABZ2N2I6_9BACI